MPAGSICLGAKIWQALQRIAAQLLLGAPCNALQRFLERGLGNGKWERANTSHFTLATAELQAPTGCTGIYQQWDDDKAMIPVRHRRSGADWGSLPRPLPIRWLTGRLEAMHVH